MQEPIVSIVEQGGAASAAYGVGVLKALHQHYGLRNVDYGAGDSAGATNIAFYLADQVDGMIKIWTENISTKDFLDKKRFLPWIFFNSRPGMDLDYLVDDVFRKLVPLDVEKVKASPAKLFVPLTDAVTGNAVYFDNKMENVDFLQVLKAAMSMPIAYNKLVDVNGHPYFDGGTSAPVPIDRPEIADSIKIVALTKPANMAVDYNKDLKKLFPVMWKIPKNVRRAMSRRQGAYEENMARLKEYSARDFMDNGAIVIRPSRQMPRFDTKKASIEANIEMGFQDTVNNEQVQQLIANLKQSEKAGFYFGK